MNLSLYKLRKKLKVFNKTESYFIRKNLTFIENLDDFLIAYKINDNKNTIYIVLNAGFDDISLNKTIRKQIFGNNNNLIKVFSKMGKMKKRIDVSDMEIIKRHSANVYIKGENNGL